MRLRRESLWAADERDGKRDRVYTERLVPQLDAAARAVSRHPRQSRLRARRALLLGVWLTIGSVATLPACSQHRAPGPSAEESLPSSPQNDPDLPKKKSVWPGEEALGTTMLVVLLLALAAGAAYLSFVVIPDAID